MTTIKSCFAALCLVGSLAGAQGLDPSDLLKPLGDSWLSYSGDYSGKRYSSLKQINQTNVKNLTLAWTSRVTAGSAVTPAGPGGVTPALTVAGIGALEAAGTAGIKGSILEVGGILYVSTPDNAWAVDARNGHQLWHFVWKTRGGTHIGNRGLALWHNTLYMETPDDLLVAIDARTGKELWHQVIADFDLQYFSTTAPMVIGNHVLVGTGNDLDQPGFLQSFDPETGKLQWKFNVVPMAPGDPGLDTWPNLDAARHGGGNPWIPGSYDPETKLYIFGSGNPSPAYTGQMREGDNLYTCSIIAVNVETGKMAWYYQTSPHDTHDWDSAQTPILADAPFGGRMRKLVMTASRNGYYFTLDRVTGEHLVTGKLSETANWAKGINAKGQPVRDPAKDHHIAGSLVSGNNAGAVNWPPPAFNPDTGLFYTPLQEAYAMYYLAETDPRGAMGLGGKDEIGLGSAGTYLAAIDYKTGKVAWKHQYRTAAGGGSASGILTTAGGLVFAGDVSGNLVAFDAAKGNPLWHVYLGSQVSNAAQTYMLDGHQYILTAAGDTLYSFLLY